MFVLQLVEEYEAHGHDGTRGAAVPTRTVVSTSLSGIDLLPAVNSRVSALADLRFTFDDLIDEVH